MREACLLSGASHTETSILCGIPESEYACVMPLAQGRAHKDLEFRVTSHRETGVMSDVEDSCF